MIDYHRIITKHVVQNISSLKGVKIKKLHNRFVEIKIYLLNYKLVEIYLLHFVCCKNSQNKQEAQVVELRARELLKDVYGFM